MAEAESIASVTVAFNGESLLRRHLDSLLQQSRPLNEIIVVNNASSDGTLRLLREHYPQVTVLDLPTNSGVGGGYASGLDYAAKTGRHDWVWLFDQDSAPKKDGLERLLGGLERLGSDGGRVAILAPLCVHQKTKLSYPGLLWRNGWQKARLDGADNGISFVDAVISSGTLIRTQALKEAGLPRADFFIDYVDFEHCLRLRRHAYEIAVVHDSLLEHEMGDPREVDIAGFSRVWADHAPWREYYLARNEIFTIWTYFPHWRAKLSVARRLFRHGLGAALFGKQKLACLKMMCLGISDGRAGRLGIRFLEQPELPRSTPR